MVGLGRRHLLPAGANRFPYTHAELTRVAHRCSPAPRLREQINSSFACVRRKLNGPSTPDALSGATTLRTRVARLAEVRSREGYMPEWRADADGFLLLENHCPICAAARGLSRFLRAELDVFRDVLGPWEPAVDRIEHVLAGARRCAYRITQIEARKRDGRRCWTDVMSLAKLVEDEAVIRTAGAILLVQSETGRFACANRCPHEGYPLSEGTLTDGCVLTWNWHNWKFNLANGATLVGGDRLTRYPVRLEAGRVWLDVTPPDPGRRREEILAGVVRGLEDLDQQRLVRETARLARPACGPRGCGARRAHLGGRAA